MKRIFFVLIFSIISSLSFCQSKNEENITAKKNDTTIYNKVWVLQRLNNKKIKYDMPSEKITLVITSENEYASGTSGCNAYVGKVIRKKNRLYFRDIGTTKMACPEEIITNERIYLDNLTKITSYKIIEEDLYLYNGDRPILIYSKE